MVMHINDYRAQKEKTRQNYKKKVKGQEKKDKAISVCILNIGSCRTVNPE